MGYGELCGFMWYTGNINLKKEVERMEKKLKMRNEVPVEETWDLSLIYPNADAMYADLEKARELTRQLKETYEGKLNTAEAICGCLNLLQEISVLKTYVGTYAFLAVEVDHYNSENMDRASRVGAALSAMAGDLSFVESEIVQQSTEVLQSAISMAGGAANYLKNILREKAYRLHP